MNRACAGLGRLLVPVALILLLTAAAALDDVVRLPEVVADGTPRGLVTIVIAVPVELRD